MVCVSAPNARFSKSVKLLKGVRTKIGVAFDQPYRTPGYSRCQRSSARIRHAVTCRSQETMHLF
jgi:hypothetical protein